MIDDFDDFIKTKAIALYLQGYGYKAQVDRNTLTAYVQDPVGDTFVVVAIPTWEIAREFIKVRSQA
jgi:hypothetical protein